MDRIDKINAFLAQKGMTGADLSRAIGVSNSIYSQWNKKKSRPSNKTLNNIAEALGVPVESLLSDDELPPETKKAPVPEDEGLDREMMEQLRALDSEGIRALKAFLSAYNGGNKK